MPKLRAKKTVFLTPQGKASFDSNEGKNTLLARQDTTIDAHTVEKLELEKLFTDDAKKCIEEAEAKSSMLEQAKARQETQDAPKNSAPTEPLKTGNSKNEGGSK